MNRFHFLNKFNRFSFNKNSILFNRKQTFLVCRGFSNSFHLKNLKSDLSSIPLKSCSQIDSIYENPISKSFDSEHIEKHWYDWWQDNQLFKPKSDILKNSSNQSKIEKRL